MFKASLSEAMISKEKNDWEEANHAHIWRENVLVKGKSKSKCLGTTCHFLRTSKGQRVSEWIRGGHDARLEQQEGPHHSRSCRPCWTSLCPHICSPGNSELRIAECISAWNCVSRGRDINCRAGVGAGRWGKICLALEWELAKVCL